MASIPTHIEVRPEPKNTRVNEIVAIALAASAVLLFLCLVTYSPNDPSWNAAGQTEARNWIGAVGANVSAALFQGIGLAAYLLPLLLVAASWRRFRSRRISAPLFRFIGLVVLVLSSSALLSLANIHPLFDASFHPGGLTGELIARAMVSGLNRVGATILLIAIAATGLLLALNVSFASLYESVVSLLSNRFLWLGNIPRKFRVWRQARVARSLLRTEARQQAKADRAALKAARRNGKVSESATGGGETLQSVIVTTSIAPSQLSTENAELATGFASASATTVTAKAAAAAAGAAIAPAKRSLWSSRGRATPVAESAVVEEMVRDAAVKRKTESPASGSLPFDGGRRISTRTAAFRYQLPAVDLLNEAEMRREQADDELLNMATRLAEKCREF